MKIHEQVKLNAARTADILQQIAVFRDYLHGPKFQGHDPRDGTPMNYINTNEVLARLRQIEDVLSGVEDDNLADR
jgi:hypothetical protein